MKSTRLIILIVPLMASCAFFKDYTKEDQWSYFEEWDTKTDNKIDKEEFEAGCVKDGFVKKGDLAAADSLFVKADENKDGVLTGLEFYRWKIHFQDPADPNVNAE